MSKVKAVLVYSSISGLKVVLLNIELKSFNNKCNSSPNFHYDFIENNEYIN